MINKFLTFSYYPGKFLGVGNGYDKEDMLTKFEGVGTKNQTERESILPPPPPPPLKKNPIISRENQGPAVAREEDDDIFVGEGVNYEVPAPESPVSEDMEESPRNKEKPQYFAEPVYGPVPPSMMDQGWQETVS
jgi:IK cytokine